MFALAVVATPNANSFSHAMAAPMVEVLRRRGHEFALHDLCGEQFDPVQPTREGGNTNSNDALVEQHCRELARADLILVFHPIRASGNPQGLGRPGLQARDRLRLSARRGAGGNSGRAPALVFNTSNTPIDRERDMFGDSLENLWKRCIFELCGVQDSCDARSRRWQLPPTPNAPHGCPR